MSEKRFTNHWTNKFTNKKQEFQVQDHLKKEGLTNEEIIDRLNELNDGNEQLRQTNERLEQECRQHLATNLRLLEQLENIEEKNIKLKDENEQLRKKIGICKDFLQKITLSNDSDGLNVTLWDILMENDNEEFGEYLKRKAILKKDIKKECFG